MVTILRILFVLAAFKLFDWGIVFITTLISKEGLPLGKVLTRSLKNSSLLTAVFFTLWCIEKGWI